MYKKTNQYSIDDILSAVDDLRKLKKEKKNSFIELKKDTSIKDNSSIPTHTLKLIKDAENFSN